MSRERAPVMKPPGLVDRLRTGILKANPFRKGSSVEQYGTDLKKMFERAQFLMARREYQWRHGTSRYKPHQNYKECTRRQRQLRLGQIHNYVHGQQYPQMY